MAELTMSPRMRFVWSVLEGAKDAGDDVVVAALRDPDHCCPASRRLILALKQRRGDDHD
jgi:hypothetical protein